MPGRTVTYTADGLPGGLSIDAATGRVTGVLESAGYQHATITAHDDAGRSGSASLVWYVAGAQASARSGPITMNGDCLAAAGGTATLAKCSGGRSTTGTLQPDDTLRTANQCLTAADTATVADCDGGTGQRWRLGTSGQLTNPASGQCLTTPASGAAPVLRPCTRDTGQRWTLPAGPILSAVPGLCADGADATGVRTWYCADVTDQAWTVATDGSVRLGGRCLSVDGDAVTVQNCGRAPTQWQIRDDGALVDQATGSCLAIPGDSRVVATRLVATTCDVRAGQLWHVE